MPRTGWTWRTGTASRSGTRCRPCWRCWSSARHPAVGACRHRCAGSCSAATGLRWTCRHACAHWRRTRAWPPSVAPPRPRSGRTGSRSGRSIPPGAPYRTGFRWPTSPTGCSMPTCAIARTGSMAICISAAPAWLRATGAIRSAPPRPSSPTPPAQSACTAPATARATGRTAASNFSGASTARSSSAATASSWARSKPR